MALATKVDRHLPRVNSVLTTVTWVQQPSAAAAATMPLPFSAYQALSPVLKQIGAVESAEGDWQKAEWQVSPSLAHGEHLIGPRTAAWSRNPYPLPSQKEIQQGKGEWGLQAVFEGRFPGSLSWLTGFLG